MFCLLFFKTNYSYVISRREGGFWNYSGHVITNLFFFPWRIPKFITWQARFSRQEIVRTKLVSSRTFGKNYLDIADFERWVYFKVILILFNIIWRGGEARVAILINTSDKYDIKLTAGRNALGHTAIVSCARINLIVWVLQCWRFL